MDKQELFELINKIQPVNRAAGTLARDRLFILAKPPGSLGKLEDIAVQIAEITGKTHNHIKKKCVIIMCADNGVVAEGIASAPQSVTLAQSINFTRGLTGVAAIAKEYHSDLKVIDVGINADVLCDEIEDKKIRKGTNNIAKEPAMTESEAITALHIGINAVKEVFEAGYDIIGVGEMGIGNTTTSSAVLAALTGIDVVQCVGKGAGLDKAGFERKKQIIQTALLTFKPDPKNPIDVLSKVGGFDIGAMAGVYLGAALYKLPIVIDGYISAVAALLAAELNPLAKGYMIASHSSYEIGFKHVMKELAMEAPLNLNMRLGEGSGCPIMFMVVEGACAVINNMGTFKESNINEDYLDAINSEDSFKV